MFLTDFFKSQPLLKMFIILTLIWIIIVFQMQRRLNIKNKRNARTILQLHHRVEMDAFLRRNSKDVVIPDVHVVQANCKAIINNNAVEIEKAIYYTNTTRKRPLRLSSYILATNNCSEFLKRRMYITEPLSKMEAEFKVAYSIMVYKDIEQFERLLRAIYRPQNYYCIHVDAKRTRYLEAVQKILACFTNIFLASKLIDVKWGKLSALEPDVICMQDLWRRFKDWKYFINLTGQEFPLRTNNELVAILKTLNGSADVQKIDYFKDIIGKDGYRIRNKFIHGKRTKVKLPILPYESELNMTKGSCHVALPRSFVAYLQKSWLAKDFLQWLRVTFVPDETYIPTLNYSPRLNIPGAYRGKRPFLSRYKNWQTKGSKESVEECRGKIVRQICITGIGDLVDVTSRPELFHNKFHLKFQHLALDCMEEWFYNRTRQYYNEGKVFNVLPYIYKDE